MANNAAEHSLNNDDMTKEISPVEQNVPNPEDPTAPSKEVSSKKQSLSDLFTIFCAGAALISDGYQNSLMTMVNVVLKKEYKQYTSRYSTQVSNALIVGEYVVFNSYSALYYQH